MRAPLGQVLTAMVTPFTAEGDLDLDSASRLATRLVEDGNDGLVVSGTTGESPTTSDAEKLDLLRAVLGAVGDRATVVAGVGSNDTAHTARAARAAQEAGAHGLLVVTPYYNRPPQESLVAHFRTVADASELPVILYDIPGRTGTPITTESLLRLAEHPRIVGVKDAKLDFFGGSEVMDRTDLAYYSGDDASNLPWLALGAVGVISVVAHAFAADIRDQLVAVESGDLPKAREINARLIPAVRAIMSPASQGAIRAKAVAHLRGLIDSPQTRLPLLPATDTDLAELRAGCAASGLEIPL